MKRLTLLTLALCAGCLDSGAVNTDELDVSAVIDGEPYNGGGAAAWFAFAEPPWLLLFPAQALQGSLLGWAAGDTGTWDLAFQEACESDCNWFQYQSGGATYVSASGTLTIDLWTAIEPENAFDTRIGIIEGTFDSSLSCWMGCEGQPESVEITGGAFAAMVSETAEGDTSE
jgi:hypothetical protein